MKAVILVNSTQLNSTLLIIKQARGPKNKKKIPKKHAQRDSHT